MIGCRLTVAGARHPKKVRKAGQFLGTGGGKRFARHNFRGAQLSRTNGANHRVLPSPLYGLPLAHAQQ
jgi:hypothetical protein